MERSDFMAQISLRVDDDVKRGAERAAYPLWIVRRPILFRKQFALFWQENGGLQGGAAEFFRAWVDRGMTIQIRVIQWEFGAAALKRNIDLSMWLRIVQRWLSHAGEIMTFRGRETALFFSVCKLLLWPCHMCSRGGDGRMQWNEITVYCVQK